MSSDVARRWLLPALSALLAALWLGGGVTQDGTSMDEWLQLLALPVLWMSVRVLLVESLWHDLEIHALYEFFRQRLFGLVAADGYAFDLETYRFDMAASLLRIHVRTAG